MALTITDSGFTSTTGLNLGSYTYIATVLETGNVMASAPASNVNFDVITQGIQYYTANATSNCTINLRGNATTTMNTLLSTGQSATIALMMTNGATPYYANNFQVDGVGQTVKWLANSAPTSGNANSVDIYMVTTIKTGSSTYSLFGSQSQFK